MFKLRDKGADTTAYLESPEARQIHATGSNGTTGSQKQKIGTANVLLMSALLPISRE